MYNFQNIFFSPEIIPFKPSVEMMIEPLAEFFFKILLNSF